LNLSIIIVSYDDQDHLDRLLSDIYQQDYDFSKVEILILEAGANYLERTQNILREKKSKLRYFHIPRLGRTSSLNKLVENCTYDFIIRLDSRSSIKKDYLKKITNLSKITGAENVGGVMKPTYLNDKQRIISYVMRSKWSFGGANFRDETYNGYTDSVYLGAFNRNKIEFQKWFDEDFQEITEDSDLNYRIRQNGGKIFLDSSIIVEHYPRETFQKFLRLCFNYGLGRGIFLLKHKTFSAIRQIVPITFYFFLILTFIIGLKITIFFWILLLSVMFYFLVIYRGSFEFTLKTTDRLRFTFLTIGCHFYWTIGLINSLKYIK